MIRRGAGPLLVAAAAAACAQPSPPPGGQVDRTPPRVVEVSPAMFDTLPALDQPVVIRFDERLSERLQGVRDWTEAVLVSPATGAVRVRARRRSLEVSLQEGWQDGQVYRVQVRPVFQDLFGNRRTEPIEVVFSTGAPISEAALAGFVTDRLTGRPVADARVRAVRRIDQTPYVAITDTAGFFALRFVPAGAYDVRSWQDQDRDREADAFEMQDSAAVVFGAGDTAVVSLALLRPDTTPARLASAEALDSTKVRLTFDDYFAVGPVDGEAFVRALPDSALVGTGQLLHGTRLDSIRAAEAEARAAREAEETAEDTLAEAPDTTGQPDPRAGPPAGVGRAGAERAGAGSRAPLPSRELLLVLAPELLEPDSTYYVRVVNVTNIGGVEGGGGTAAFRTPPRPEPAPAPPDSVPPDSVPPDTMPPDPSAGDAARRGGGR